MLDYMLLLYATPTDEEGEQARLANMPAWLEVVERLRESGVLLSNNRLHAPDMATTLRMRDGEADITDGPFAVTKEILVGYFLIRCAGLDEALKHAEELPILEYGSVEIRPIAGV